MYGQDGDLKGERGEARPEKGQAGGKVTRYFNRIGLV